MPVFVWVAAALASGGALGYDYLKGDKQTTEVTAETYIANQTKVSTPAILAVSAIAIGAGYLLLKKG